MRTLIFVAAMLAVIFGAATLSGCQSTGQRYHQGDRWEMYRFDRNLNPHRVR